MRADRRVASVGDVVLTFTPGVVERGRASGEFTPLAGIVLAPARGIGALAPDAMGDLSGAGVNVDQTIEVETFGSAAELGMQMPNSLPLFTSLAAHERMMLSRMDGLVDAGGWCEWMPWRADQPDPAALAGRVDALRRRVETLESVGVMNSEQVDRHEEKLKGLGDRLTRALRCIQSMLRAMNTSSLGEQERFNRANQELESYIGRS